MAAMIFFIAAFAFSVFLHRRTRGVYDGYIEPLDPRKHPIRQYLPMGLGFMDMLRYRYRTGYDQKLLRRFAELSGQKEAEYFLKIHWAEKVCYGLLIMLLFSFFGSILWLQEAISGREAVETVLIKGNELAMPAFGEGGRAVDIHAEIRKGELSQQRQYTVRVPEAAPPGDIAAVDKALERLTADVIKGSNASLDRVSRDLKLKNHYEELGNLGIAVEWKSSNPAAVSEDGSVTVPQAPQKAEAVTLTAIISKGAVKKEKAFEVRLWEAPLTDGQIIAKVYEELERGLKEIERGRPVTGGAADGNRIKLPTSSSRFEDVAIAWSPEKAEKAGSGISAIVAALAVGGLIAYLLDRDVNSKVDKRRMRIKYDFPEFLNKLLLLLNAGMTVGRAIEKIAGDSGRDGPLYQELRAAMGEIKGGKPEYQALEEFAGRCRIPEVSKFVSALLQNLRKGSGELILILRLQSNECWEMRKSMAKRMGEEASTKLLLPMMLMLVAILMIVATPAVLSMKGF